MKQFEFEPKAKLVLALNSIPGIGPSKIRDFYNQNEGDYNKCLENVLNRFMISEEEFKSKMDAANEILERNKSEGISFFCIFDSDFPRFLYDGANPVILLFYIGNIKLIESKMIAVIGTRKPTYPFTLKGEKLVEELAIAGYTIVSGLAIGSDTIAHKTALRCNAPTIAVLPSPCDNIYPAENKKLASDIVEHGGLILSEYSSGLKFTKYNLVARDRIQSYISEKIVVIQSSETGGSMHAVRASLKANKPVFALQGNVITEIKNYIDPDLKSDLEKVIRQNRTLDSFF